MDQRMETNIFGLNRNKRQNWTGYPMYG